MTPDVPLDLPDQLFAHHAALLAIPAFVPAVVVVGVVLYIARKDRIAEREENETLQRALDPDTPHDDIEGDPS